MDPIVKRHKADSDFSVNEQEWSAIREAAANNNVEAMKVLLGDDKERQRELMHSKVYAHPLLVLALRNPAPSLEMIQLLIDAGSDVNSDNCYGPPLRYAVNSGNLNVVKLLVAAGACVDGRLDPDRDTALHYAAQAKNLEMLRYFLDICDWRQRNECNESALYWACRSNFTEGVELLLKYDKYGVLTIAVDDNNKDMLEMLLAAGASVTWKDVKHCLMSKKTAELLKILIDTSFDTVLAVVRSEFHYMLKNIDHVECVLQGLQNHEDCDKLERKMLDGDNITYLVHKDWVLLELKVFFEYYFTYEPRDLFCKFVQFNDLTLMHYFVMILSEIGVRGCWKEKQKVLRFWEKFPDKYAWARNEAAANLQQPVLDLKRLSAMAARSHIRHYTGSNWMARLMVQESALPTICKQQLFLRQFSSHIRL